MKFSWTKELLDTPLLVQMIRSNKCKNYGIDLFIKDKGTSKISKKNRKNYKRRLVKFITLHSSRTRLQSRKLARRL